MAFFTVLSHKFPCTRVGRAFRHHGKNTVCSPLIFLIFCTYFHHKNIGICIDILWINLAYSSPFLLPAPPSHNFFLSVCVEEAVAKKKETDVLRIFCRRRTNSFMTFSVFKHIPAQQPWIELEYSLSKQLRILVYLDHSIFGTILGDCWRTPVT